MGNEDDETMATRLEEMLPMQLRISSEQTVSQETWRTKNGRDTELEAKRAFFEDTETQRRTTEVLG